VSTTAPVDRNVLLACELALVGVSAAVIGGFSRLFVDGSFFPKIAVMAAIAHGLAILVRRLHRGIIMSAAVSLAGLCITGGVLFYNSTTRLGLPTLATRDAARTDLSDAWHLFGDVRAPAPVHPGFVLAAGIAMWVVAFLADWAAFRLWSPAEACAPAGIVFLFSSLQSADRHQISSTAAFAGAVLVFVLLHRVARQDTGASWLATEPGRGRGSLVRVGTLVGAAAIITGLVVGPALPGAGEEAVVPWRNFGDGSGAGDGSRVTVSPLVTIKSRLVDLSNVEAFTVATDKPDYWRLTALDKFDGVAWTSSGQYETADGVLPTALPPGTVTNVLRQTFTIEKLDTLWLPAAYEPQSVVEAGGTKPSYEAESGTLTIGDNVKTSDGKTYTVESRVPTRNVDVLRAASTVLPADVRARYLALPSDFSRRARSDARSVTRTSTTTYDKARALQDWFRANFQYSLTVVNGHGSSAIDDFLYKNKAGYCEQFASAYAAMARAIGIPARVAVGFTPGELGDDGLYHVRGEHAHAWPEVFLPGSGWVRFEPTPNRGAPGDEVYTGVAPAQPVTGDPGAAVTPTSPTTSAAPSTAAPGTDPAADIPPELAGGVSTNDGGTGGSTPSGKWTTFLQLAAVILAAAALVTLAIPVVKLGWRARRRARLGTTPRGRVDSAWADTVDTLGLLDVPPDPPATPHELARRAAPVVGPEAAPALADLAELTTSARFAPDGPDDAAVARAAHAAHLVRHVVTHRVSRGRRIRRALDPRPLLAGLRAAQRAETGPPRTGEFREGYSPL
jgi:transglutaminase-like putative cysteine protease